MILVNKIFLSIRFNTKIQQKKNPEKEKNLIKLHCNDRYKNVDEFYILFRYKIAIYAHHLLFVMQLNFFLFYSKTLATLLYVYTVYTISVVLIKIYLWPLAKSSSSTPIL